MGQLCREAERTQEAKKWQEFGFDAMDAWEKSSEERSTITLKDKFAPVALTDEELARLVEQVSLDERVKRVWLAAKEVEYYSEKPLCLIGVEAAGSIFTPRLESYYHTLAQDLVSTLVFEHQFFVVILRGENAKFKRKFKKLGREVCCIYER